MNFKRGREDSSTQHFKTEQGPKIIFHKCLFGLIFLKAHLQVWRQYFHSADVRKVSSRPSSSLL